MATDKEASLNSCASDPNFAVICSFLNQFAASCGIAHPTFSELQEMLEDTQEVSQILIDIHIKLLRKARKSFTADKWEKALAKFCHTYSQQDGWELERFGYKKARLSVKVKLLKVLLETQFDVNGKFKSEVNKVGAKVLRLEPLGRDQNGFQYWCQFDKSSHVRIYREDLDDETWELVASDRNGLVQLIDSLSNGEGQLELNSILNEDSTSQEIEKPITDNGQGEDKQEEVDNDNEDGDDEDEDEEEEEGEEQEEEEDEEEVEEEEEEEEVDDEDKMKEKNNVEKQAVEEKREQKQAVEEKKEQKTEAVEVKPDEAVSILGQEKPIALTNGSNALPHPSLIRPVEQNMSSLTGVDLSIKSDLKKYLPTPNDYYPPVPDRPYIPERNDILSQMSARFNDRREAEDLSFNPAKKLRLDNDDDQPMMLVKKDIVVSEAIEEPVRLVTGPGSGEDCQLGNPLLSKDIEEVVQYVLKLELGLGLESNVANPSYNGRSDSSGSEDKQSLFKEESEFSEVIEEPLQYVVGPGSGVECDAANPKHNETSDLSDSEDEKSAVEEEPEFSEVIEEPVQYVVGLGSGVECDVANPMYNGRLDLNDSDDKQSVIEEEPEFSEVIEEPVQFIVGLGSGIECEIGNPQQYNGGEPSISHSISIMGIENSFKSLSLATREPKFSEVIEEPVMFVHGTGYGEDCLTGNPDEVDESIEEKAPEKKPKLWSIDAICSSQKLLTESLNQNIFGSSQKDPAGEACSSRMPDGNGTLNCTKGNIANDENSSFNLSNNINSSLKPFSGVKPILENIPMKDKPPDSIEPGSANFVPEVSNDISSYSNESSSNCMSNVREESDKNQVQKSESIPSSIIAQQASSDFSSDNCTPEVKSTADEKPPITNCTIKASTIPPVPDSKMSSEDNSSSSIIPGESVEDKESSNVADGVLASHPTPNVFIDKEREKSDERSPSELPDSSSKLDNDSCPDVNSSKANSKKSKTSNFGKNYAESISDINSENEIKKPLVEKCENDDKLNSLLDKNNLTNCENGSKILGTSNCPVVCEKLIDLPLASGKKSKHKSSTTSSSSPEPTKSIADKSNSPGNNNPAALDKNEEKRKNVMLTNIIEVCLDNDNYSKDDAKSGLKGQMNAKFNDLFSAKNLLEPSTKMSLKETCNDLNEVQIANSSENCTGSDYSDEKAETREEDKINADTNTKDEKSDDIKKEDDINDEEVVENSLASKLVSENKIRPENCDSVKSEEIKEENPVRNTTTRGRKSRTNSVNNDEETEIPSKIRKTDTVPVTKPRRVSRRNTSSTSQNDVCLEPEDGKLVVQEIITKSKNNSGNIIKDPVNVETDLKEEKTENQIEQKNENDKAVEEVPKKEEKEEETNESTKKEVVEIDCEMNQDKEGNEKSSVQENKSFTLASFSLEQPLEDGPVLGKPPDLKPQPSRKRRNSRKLSRSEEDGGEIDDGDKDGDEAGGKKPRLRAKTRRSKGTPLSIKHVQPNESSSDDNQVEDNTDLNSKDKRRFRGRPMKKKGKGDAPAPSKSKQGKAKVTGKNTEKGSGSNVESETEKEEAKPVPTKKETRKKQQSSKEDSEKEDKKAKGKSKGRPKKEAQSNKEERGEESVNEDKDEEKESVKREVGERKEEEENDSKPVEDEQAQPKKKGRPKKQKNLLGLLECDLIHSKPSPNETEGSRVRQSRRIAQIKIKEEAERRAIEEATMMLTMKEVKKKTPKDESKQTPKKQKKKKGKTENVSEEEDETFKEPSEEKKKGRKKKKKKGLTYDINKPWQSSSDDSSEEAEEEEEHFEEEEDEEDIRASKVVSDHEFSPESDLEKDETVEPIRRARTAKKVDEDEVKDEVAEASEDYPCKKCGQPDHPEWILLCDKCDSGYHASCLRPTLMLIPEGDWFCPPCQHLELVSKLKETLRAFEKNTKRRENEELRKKRLAYVGISLANVLPTQEKSQSFGGGRRIMSESSESSSEESESTDDDEPVYQLRQRRAALQANYRFNDYDELINSAIQDEMEAVKGAGNMGRGKDIANIVEAEKKAALTDEAGAVVEEEPNVVEEEEQGENWRPPVVPKNTSLPSLRKKPKKLTDLDKQSEDDADSDEDFKGSSEEEEFSSTEGGDSDDSLGRRQPVRRSSRARISRIDKEFINDDSESSDEPRKKKTRRLWASSSSESSDTTWGRRKRKSKTYNRIRTSKSSRKKKKMVLDSDSDRPKKPKTKRPKIRYGLSEDEGEPLRRTRGKKMSYLEVAGSDTEEEVIARSRKMIRSDDEEEFVPEKEEVGEDEVEPVEEIEEEEVEDEEEEVEEEEEEDEEDENEEKGKEKAKPEPQEKVIPEAKEKKEGQVKEEVNKLPEKEALKVPVPEIQNKEPVVEPEPEKQIDDDEDDDQVEEEEIEEEVEEEVEEEEEEEEDDDSQIEEVKNLVREKIEEPKGIIQPPIKVGTGVSIIKVPVVPTLGPANSNPTTPHPALPTATAIPTPVIKEEKKEEKKEPTPAIRLVPSAKLLDPNKRRPPEESVIRGMIGGGGYFRPPPLQPPGRQPFRQRFSEQQRYLFQAPPASHHQFYPGGAFYAGEDYVVGSGYEEQIDPNGPGGDEEGVFSGLVSYFSSQREDNLDS